MKKLFLFTVALLTSLMVGATIHTLEPGERQIEGVINSLADGDVIELQTGTYTEWSSLTFSTKVTIQAAEGATPKLALYNWQIQNGFEINGVEIKNVSKDNYLFRITSEVAGTVAFKNCSMQLHDEVTSLQSYIRVEKAVGTLTIDNCVFKEFNATLANPVSHIKLGAAVGKLTINNCIFKDNAKIQETILAAQSYSITNFSMTNCTAYNCGGVNNDLAIFCEHATNVYVDHCTFYNCGTRVIYFTNDVKENYLVQNCVVANSDIPTSNNYCIASYAGEVKNCAYYKVNAPRGSDATVTGCINANPLFAAPANGDFSFPVNSPLAFAATDGSHIGDPRWSVNISGAVDITTQLNIENQACGTAKAATDDETLIEFYPSKSNSKDTALWAGWVVNTEALAYKIAAEVTVASDWSLNMFLCDIATGALVNKYEYPSGSSSAISPVDLGTWDLSQVPAGQYLLKVKNKTAWGNIQLKSLVFTSAGGAVVDIPETLPVADAILSSGASINEDGYITYHDAGTDNARWNINATKAGSMSVTMDVVATDGHTYMVALYSMEGDSITAVKEKEWTSASGIMNLVGTIAIPQAGNYYVVVKNMVSGSHATFKDVTFTYAGGAVVDILGTLPIGDAVMNGNRVSKTETEISWNNSDDDASSYVTWNVNATKIGQYDVILNEDTEVGHNYTVSLMNGSETLTSVSEGKNVWKQGEISLGKIAIEEEGSYTIKLTNTTFNSSSKVTSLSLNYLGGTVVEMPGTLQADDALLGGDDKVKVDGDGYICFSNDENVPNCWATWQTNWVKTGTYDVILDVNATKGHKLVVEVLDGETVIKTFEYGYSEESGKLSIGKFVLPETKSYTIRLTNKLDWSDARIKSIAFIPFIAIGNDDEDVDFTEYENQFVSVQLNRTFKANMYNPICLPFALSSSALSNILKADKSYVLGSASLEEQKLYVELKQGSGIYQGTPNMIKPSEDVENPVFTNVEIKTTSPDQTTRDVLRLQGSFASHVIDNHQTALLVGANNTLFFPNDETPYIKSMRAYFILVGQAAGAPIKAACFREPGNAPTWMEVQNAECTMHNGKVIRDGRFVIVRDGKEYNAQGIEL